MKKIFLIGSLALLALLVAGCGSSGNNTAGNAVVDGDYITIPISDLSNKVQFYEYDYNGVKISYFAVLGSDGRPRTAFDACDLCGGYKGYRQSGNDITCNNCGRVFSIDSLGSKNKGYGCWPSYLEHKIEDGELLIKKSNIQEGAFRFA